MNLLARIVSRRVRRLEAALDTQRAQTLAWHTLHAQVQQARTRDAERHQAKLDELAKACAENVRLAKELNDCWAVRVRMATERNAALREADLLRDKVAVPDVRYPMETAPYQDALTAALRRLRLAEDNCLRLENQLAVYQDRPVIGALR